MNDYSNVEHSYTRTPFAPLQAEASGVYRNTPKSKPKAFYLSPLESKITRSRTAKEFGLTPPPCDPFLRNQSFPDTRKGSKNTRTMNTKYIDKFESNNLTTYISSPMKNSSFNDPLLNSYLGHNANNPDSAILTVDVPTGVILMANKVACSLLGINKPDGLHKITDFINAKNNEISVLQSVADSVGETGIIVNVVNKSNEIIPMSVWRKDLITEDYKRVLYVLNSVEFVKAKVQYDATGKVLDCNEEFVKLFCFESIEEACGLNLSNFASHLKVKIDPNVDETEQNYFANGLTKDGFLFPFYFGFRKVKNDTPAVYDGKFYAYKDKTRKSQGEIMLDEDGYIIKCNTNFSNHVFGYSADELIKKHISLLLPVFSKPMEHYIPAEPQLDSIVEDSNESLCDIQRPINPLAKPFREIPNVEILSPSPVKKCAVIPKSNSEKENLSYINEDDSICDKSRNNSSFDDSDFCCEKLIQLNIGSKPVKFQSNSMENSSEKSDVNANILESVEEKEKSYQCNDEAAISESDTDSEQSENEDEDAFDSEDDVISDEELANIELGGSEEISTPLPTKDCDITECEDFSMNQLRNSTPKANKRNNSSFYDNSFSINDALISCGYAKHKEGETFGIKYIVKKATLGNGKPGYCLQIYRASITRKMLNKMIDQLPHIRNILFDKSILPESEEKEDESELKEEKSEEEDDDDGESSQEDDSQNEPNKNEKKIPFPKYNKKYPSDASDSFLAVEEYCEGEFSSKYTAIEELGRGAHGCVLRAYRKSDRQLAVAKCIKLSDIKRDSWTFDTTFDRKVPLEVKLLNELDHPNIVKVIDFLVNEKSCQIVMEKHGNGLDLFDFIERKLEMDEPLASYIFRQIVDAVAYLHANGLVHRDIKDENIIIDEKFHIKLIDFGAAAFMGSLFTSFIGTTEYCCPEILNGEKYRGPELDMFSLGVTLFTLIDGQNPFGSESEVLSGEYYIKPTVSESLSGLIKHLLQPKSKLRCTLPELQNHPWINQQVCIENYRFEDVICDATEEELNPVRCVTLSFQKKFEEKILIGNNLVSKANENEDSDDNENEDSEDNENVDLEDDENEDSEDDENEDSEDDANEDSEVVENEDSEDDESGEDHDSSSTDDESSDENSPEEKLRLQRLIRKIELGLLVTDSEDESAF